MSCSNQHIKTSTKGSFTSNPLLQNYRPLTFFRVKDKKNMDKKLVAAIFIAILQLVVVMAFASRPLEYNIYPVRAVPTVAKVVADSPSPIMANAVSPPLKVYGAKEFFCCLVGVGQIPGCCDHIINWLKRIYVNLDHMKDPSHIICVQIKIGFFYVCSILSPS